MEKVNVTEVYRVNRNGETELGASCEAVVVLDGGQWDPALG